MACINGIELRHLRYFVGVAEALSFTEAARRLGVSQPSVTTGLRQLETRLGVKLVRRNSRNVRLTPAGLAFLDDAREVLARSEESVVEVRSLRGSVVPTLTVGYWPGAALELTGPIGDEFLARSPDVELRWRECKGDVTAGLRDGEADLAIVRTPFDTSGLRVVGLFEEPRYVALAARHPLARREHVAMAEIADEPIVAYATDDEQLRDWWLGIAQRSAPPHIAVEAHTVSEQLESVRFGRAIAIVPASAARFLPQPGVAYVPVLDLPPSRVSLAWRPERSGVLSRRFVDCALRVVAREPSLLANITMPSPRQTAQRSSARQQCPDIRLAGVGSA